jgi:hypothetical protein
MILLREDLEQRIQVVVVEVVVLRLVLVQVVQVEKELLF